MKNKELLDGYIAKMKICINYIFCHIQNKVSPMEFLEIVTCWSIQLGARFAFSLLKANKLLTQLLFDTINSCS